MPDLKIVDVAQGQRSGRQRQRRGPVFRPFRHVQLCLAQTLSRSVDVNIRQAEQIAELGLRDGQGVAVLRRQAHDLNSRQQIAEKMRHAGRIGCQWQDQSSRAPLQAAAMSANGLKTIRDGSI